MKRLSAALLLALIAIAPAYAAPPTKAELDASEAKFQQAEAVKETDWRAALPLYEEAAQLGQDPDIAYMLAVVNQNILKNDKQAAHWMALAADWGNVDAKFQFATMRVSGYGAMRDVIGGLDTIDEMARAGYEPAQGAVRQFRSEQDAKAQCLMSALREKGYQEALGSRFYRIDEGQGETSRGDTFKVRGLRNDSPAWATVRVEGYDGVNVSRYGDSFMFSSTYNARPASAEGVATVAGLRSKCELDDID
ncbi:hypothetical protein [Lysobacter sp. HA35]